MSTKTANWADGPYKLIAPPSASRDITTHFAYFMAEEMSFIHNLLIRGLNAIYLQAPAIQAGTADARDFLFFASSWARMVHHHHDIEEDMLFPMIEEVPGVPREAMAGNIAQHEAFEPGLHAFQEYAQSTAPEAYDAAKLRAMIEDFAPVFVEHLGDEIPNLSSLAATGPETSARFQEIWAACGKKAQADEPTIFGPLTFGLSDRTVAPSFPPAPAFVPYLVKYVFAWPHRGAWRFLPATFFRDPRPTPFLPEPAELARLKGELVVEVREIGEQDL